MSYTALALPFKAEPYPSLPACPVLSHTIRLPISRQIPQQSHKGHIRKGLSNIQPKKATVKIQPPNAEDFRTILKSMLEAWICERDPKTSQVKQDIPGGLSMEPFDEALHER